MAPLNVEHTGSIVHQITSVRHRRVLNSHLRWTTEYSIELDVGVGHGSAPSGETRSIFERDGTIPPDQVVAELVAATEGIGIDQETFDAMVAARLPTWGNEVVYALSTAFAEASGSWCDRLDRPYHPGLLVNLFNGSLHAYTNPVRSNLHEVLLVPPRDTPITDQIDTARTILTRARGALEGLDTATVGGNSVHVPHGDIDSGTLELTARTMAGVDGTEGYRIMVDAAATSWYADGHYTTPVSGRVMTSAELANYWRDLVQQGGLAYLEDPFAESDLAAWADLSRDSGGNCKLVGDDMHSGLVERVERNHALMGAVMVKPDQCGTVTGTRRLIATARTFGLEVIASHRSIETDSDALVRLAAATDAEYIKIGPLKGFEAVAKVNTILRDNATLAEGSP